MEPIRINVTLDFSERAETLIRRLVGLRENTAPANAAPKAPEAPAPVRQDEPAPAPVPERVEISDEDLRQEVFSARSSFTGAATKIKNEIFPAFGIKASVDCPPERRAELVEALRNLKP